MVVHTFHLATPGLVTTVAALVRPPTSATVTGLHHAECMMPMRLGAPLFSPARWQIRRLAMLAAWEDESAIDEFLQRTRLGRALAAGWHVRLRFLRRWGHVAAFDGLPAVASETDPDAPVVAVTVARVKLLQVPRFIRWGLPVERLVRDHPGTTLALERRLDHRQRVGGSSTSQPARGGEAGADHREQRARAQHQGVGLMAQQRQQRLGARHRGRLGRALLRERRSERRELRPRRAGLLSLHRRRVCLGVQVPPGVGDTEDRPPAQATVQRRVAQHGLGLREAVLGREREDGLAEPVGRGLRHEIGRVRRALVRFDNLGAWR